MCVSNSSVYLYIFVLLCIVLETTSESTGSSRVDRKKYSHVIDPYSGEFVRLRDGDYYNAGRVEVYVNGSWGAVCDDYWNLNEASLVCRQLGFMQGAASAPKKSHFGMGNWKPGAIKMDNLVCHEEDQFIQLCDYDTDTYCDLGKMASAVCIPNIACEDTWVPGKDSCYKIFKAHVNHRDARNNCMKMGAFLVHIDDEEENHYLSSLLLKVQPEEAGWHTAGVRKNRQWIWKDYNSQFEFTKWFPGWSPNMTGKEPTNGRKENCLLLDRLFPYDSHVKLYTDYVWWLDDRCIRKANFICEKPKINPIPFRRVDCYKDDGSTYRGTAHKTKKGSTCRKWTDSIQFTKEHVKLGLGDHNYCRNPDNDTTPWCWVDPTRNKFGYCDIPKCKVPPEGVDFIGKFRDRIDLNTTTITPPLSTTSGDRCSRNQFYCAHEDRCIPKSWNCDGDVDCQLRDEDELGCDYVLPLFNEFINHKMQSETMEQYRKVSVERCARLCVEAKTFVCRSFTYENSSRACYLHAVNTQSTGRPIASKQHIYYELDSQTVNCTDMFNCSNGKCIALYEVCDGHDNCNDFSDETNCGQSERGIEVRLVGGDEHSGRVEVKYHNEWGIICDDGWDKRDADVICRMKGYSEALRATLLAEFGSGNGNILLDEVECIGNETTLDNCSHTGWRQHDCKPHEAAGVECLPKSKCSKGQFNCASGTCISTSLVCDGDNDCGDSMDERDCQVRIELIGGSTSREGRVEVTRNGIRGTICDDGWDDKDATVICSMLGYNRGEARINGFFGRGKGIIWFADVGCRGTELNIKDCRKDLEHNWHAKCDAHLRDAGVVCSTDLTNVVYKAVTPPPQLPESFKQCGKRPVPKRQRRDLSVRKEDVPRLLYLMGGDKSSLGLHPWQAGIRIKFEGLDQSIAHCGGTVISDTWVLSTAHCFIDKYKTMFIVRVGDLNNKILEAQEQEFEIEELILHPQYSKETKDNDLALIKIHKTNGVGIVFNTSVQPACLPAYDVQYTTGMMCQVSGWGRSEVGYPDVLRAADIPLINPTVCQDLYKGSLTSRMFCAGYVEGGEDTCQGDSGGPFVCDINGTYTLLGATSWGFGCSLPNSPGVYAKIQAFLPWIYDTIMQSG